MALYLVGSLRLLAISFAKHLVLQARSGGLHPFFLRILCQELLAFGLCCLTFFSICSLLYSLLFGKELLHDLLCLSIFHFQLATSHHIFDSLCEVIYVQALGIHLQQLMPNA